MGKLIEGFWDCHYCGTTGIGGSKRECPNCGKARDENTKFYMNPNEKHYVPKEDSFKELNDLLNKKIDSMKKEEKYLLLL